MHIRKWLKQIFCRHEWHAVGSICRFIERIDGVPVECLSEILECDKCKKRTTHFIKMPGRII